MSSVPSPQHDRMLAQQRAHEPSMEEILASIRRIISDDQRGDASVSPRAEPQALAPDFPANVASPSPVVMHPAPSYAEEPRGEPAAEWSERLSPVAQAPELSPESSVYLETPAAAPEPYQAAAASPSLLSREADAAVSAQFGALSGAMTATNAQRLEEMTRQMLRPMLKSWLDDNLPILVEKLVRAEIERVARGGR